MSVDSVDSVVFKTDNRRAAEIAKDRGAPVSSLSLSSSASLRDLRDSAVEMPVRPESGVPTGADCTHGTDEKPEILDPSIRPIPWLSGPITAELRRSQRIAELLFRPFPFFLRVPSRPPRLGGRNAGPGLNPAFLIRVFGVFRGFQDW